MPTTLVLHSQEIALLIAGIVSLVILGAIWGSVATTAAATKKQAVPPTGSNDSAWTRLCTYTRRRTYSGRHWATT